MKYFSPIFLSALLLISPLTAVGQTVTGHEGHRMLPQDFQPVRNISNPKLAQWKSQYGALASISIETTLTYLKPKLHHPGVVKVEKVTLPFQESVWVVGMVPEVVGAPQHALHHAVFSTPFESVTFCKATVPFAVGKEMTQVVLPIGYGMFTPARHQLKANLMFHNPDAVAYPKARLRVTLWYIPVSEAELKNVRTVFLDINSCQAKTADGITYMVPSKKEHLRNQQTPLVLKGSGEIVMAQGHVHDHARDLGLFLNGKTIARFIPLNSRAGNILSLPVQYLKVFFRTGDKVSLQARYYNATPAETDAMALNLLFIHDDISREQAQAQIQPLVSFSAREWKLLLDRLLKRR